MKSFSYAHRRRRRQRGQAMVEFAFIFPIFLMLALGSLLIYTWQLDIDSAQFAAEEGIQSAALPNQATGVAGLQCAAGARAYQALTGKSFVGTTTIPVGFSGGSCNPGEPNYATSCPANNAPTYTSMLHLLNISVSSSQRNVVIICANCVDISKATVFTPKPTCTAAGKTDQIQLTITVVGYKPFPFAIPFVGNRIPFYGQNSQTVQEFE